MGAMASQPTDCDLNYVTDGDLELALGFLKYERLYTLSVFWHVLEMTQFQRSQREAAHRYHLHSRKVDHSVARSMSVCQQIRGIGNHI